TSMRRGIFSFILRKKFWFWMILASHNMNIQRTEHQKYLTRILEYNGLGRLEILLLSFLGVATCPRTNDRSSTKSLMKYDEDIHHTIRTSPCVLGFDNYNHAYGSTVYNKDRNSQLILSNFTVF